MPEWAWIGLAIAGGLLAAAVLAVVVPFAVLLLVAAVRPAWVQPTVRRLLWPRYRLRVVGAEHIPESGPAVIAANHITWLDGFILAAAVPRQGKALVNADYLRVPVLGWCARNAGMVPVPQRGPRAQREAIKVARELLDRGEVFGLFPEAQVSRNGLMGPLYRGIEVILSGREDVPVIPAALDNLWGSVFSYSGGRFFRKRPTGLRRTVCVAFGPPVAPPITTFAIRQAIQAAGVRAFELRPLRDQGRRLGTIDLGLPHLLHPKLGLLAASTPDFDREGIRQVGRKPGSVGQAVPGVSLGVVDEDEHPLPADAEGRLRALVAGRPDWQDTGHRARIDRDGFVFLAEPPPRTDRPSAGLPVIS